MVDYSKWKSIEVSDDEDDIHPNIDTPSLFRWRHQARVDRMLELEKEKQLVQQEVKEMATKKSQLLEKMAEECEGDNSKYKAGIEAVIKQKENEIQEKQEELEKKERLAPWNIDTIAKDGFSKTVFNVPPKKKAMEELTDEEKSSRLNTFTKENEALLTNYGMLRKYEETKVFLLENQHLACEETSNYLVLWCLNLALEKKFKLLDHVSHQCIAMEFLLNLSKQLDVDPRSCINNLFTQLAKLEETNYTTDFDKELYAFRERIRKRAEEKIQEEEEEMLERAQEQEEEEMLEKAKEQEDVLNSLPDALKKCFTTQDIPLLHQTLGGMGLKEARKHMMRCTKAGLWVPDPNSGLEEFLEEFEVDEDEGEAINGELTKNKDNDQEPTKGDDDDNVKKSVVPESEK